MQINNLYLSHFILSDMPLCPHDLLCSPSTSPPPHHHWHHHDNNIHSAPQTAKQRLEVVNTAHFNALSADYDTRHPVARQLAHRLTRSLRGILPLDEDPTCVLDYACSTGTACQREKKKQANDSFTTGQVLCALVPLGIVRGNPGVFQSYPDPYPQKPVPLIRGTGFPGYGLGVGAGFERVCGYEKPAGKSTG